MVVSSPLHAILSGDAVQATNFTNRFYYVELVPKCGNSLHNGLIQTLMRCGFYSCLEFRTNADIPTKVNAVIHHSDRNRFHPKQASYIGPIILRRRWR
jgi:hypothetical protein